MKRSFLLLAIFSSLGLAHLSHEDFSEGKASRASVQHFVNRVTIRSQGGYRLIDANGIPDHSTGEFPNRGNPNRIQEQSYHFKMTESPIRTTSLTPTFPHAFGVALNGVPFDPGAAEFTADFEYVAGQEDLDECNGREGVTPEYPQGIYYYVLTKEFPHISRFWRGTPDQSFFKKRRPGGPGGPGGPGQRPPPPPRPF